MSTNYDLNEVQTHDPEAVKRIILEVAEDLYPAAPLERIGRLVDLTVELFHGNIKPFQAIDTHYHDLEHTLQVTLCWTRLFRNLKEYGPQSTISFALFLDGIAACLLHDSGYLKEENDQQGTGAKYTLVHESRSCKIAAFILSREKWRESQIAIVQRFISTTGPRADIHTIPFADSQEKLIAQAVASADFLAQLSDPKYLEKLPDLYAEFEESDIHREIPAAQRPFRSLDGLIKGTPSFWTKSVLPRLKDEYSSMYKFLSSPYPTGSNPYMEQASANIARIGRTAASQASEAS